MAELKKDVTYIKEEIDGLRKDFQAFCEKKADKWVEKVVTYLVIAFALVTLYYILNHVGLPTP